MVGSCCPDVERHRVWPDGTARITIRKGKNQPEPATVAVTETTARALRDIQPDDTDPAASQFGLTGETLANRVRAAARAAGRRGPEPRSMEARRYGGPVHPGRDRGRGSEVVDLAPVYSAVLKKWCGIKYLFIERLQCGFS